MPPGDVKFAEELTAFEYMMFRADVDAHSRSSLMFIETLDSVPDTDRLLEQVERASRVLPRLRQHVVAPLLPLAPARWVIDPDFSLHYHFRRVALPAPGTFRQLLDLAQVLHATPLDQGRPLWEVTLVEGLNDGESKAALFWKLSHAVTDGVGGMVLDQLIHQDSREGDTDPLPPIPTPEDVTALDLTSKAVKRLPFKVIKRSLGAVRGVAGAILRPVDTVKSVGHFVEDVRRLATPAAVEPSPLLRRRSLNRRFESLDFPLTDLRAVAKAHDASVNDTYLAAIAATMRIYHDGMGVPIEALGAAMPVNTRSSGANSTSNEWSAVTLRLPVAELDVDARIRQIRENVMTARDGSSIDPAKLIAPITAWLPQQLMAGSGTGALGFDIQVSNVPGHPTPRYIAGSRITRSVPIGPLPGVAMMATMVSFSGKCHVGVHYDTEAFKDTDLLATALREGFAEVLASVPDKKSTSKETKN